ncbi:MAG: type II secretion system F family protein [Armatimonadota bacterium]
MGRRQGVVRMPVFRYKGRDNLGKNAVGIIWAESRSDAVKRLRERGIWPTLLRENTPRLVARLSDAVLGKASSKSLAVVYRQLATMLESGMGAVRAVTLLRDTISEHRLKGALEDVLAVVKEGYPVSDGLQMREKLFGPTEVAMFRAGERSGRLSTMLRRAADSCEFQHRLLLRIRGLLTYPAILLAAWMVIPGVRLLVLNGFEAYFVGALLPNLVALGKLLAVILATRVLLLNVSAFARVYDEVKLALPVLGGVVRKLTVARFARSLADLYNAGVGPAEAVRLAAEGCGNRALAAVLGRAVPVLAANSSLSDALAVTGALPSSVLQMAAAGEQSGTVDEALTRAAEYLEAEALGTMEASLPVARVVVWALVAVPLILAILGGFIGVVGSMGEAVGR